MTLRHYLIPIRLVNMTVKENDKCWRECGKIGTLKPCWWSCELIQLFWRAIWNYAQRAIKRLSAFQPSHTTAGVIPQRGHRQSNLYKIFIAALFVGVKNWEMKECPSIREWLNKLWYMMMMEYYCVIRNDELDDF